MKKIELEKIIENKVRKALKEEGTIMNDDYELDLFMVLASHMSDVQEETRDKKIIGTMNFCKEILQIIKKGKKEMKGEDIDKIWDKWLHVHKLP